MASPSCLSHYRQTQFWAFSWREQNKYLTRWYILSIFFIYVCKRCLSFTSNPIPSISLVAPRCYIHLRWWFLSSQKDIWQGGRFCSLLPVSLIIGNHFLGAFFDDTMYLRHCKTFVTSSEYPGPCWDDEGKKRLLRRKVKYLLPEQHPTHFWYFYSITKLTFENMTNI